MRRLMIVAALAAAGLLGASACADNSTPGGGTTTSPTSTGAGADETAQVCTEAMAEGAAVATELPAKLTALDQARNSGDLDKLALLQAELYERVKASQDKLNGWAGRNIKPEVKTALSSAATTLQNLNSMPTTPTQAELQAQLSQVAVAVTVACGNT
jgi:hypothetical protein